MFRLRFPWTRRRLDEDARQELESHRALLVERYVRTGMTPEAAAAAARRRLGNVALVREDIYRMNGLPWLDRLAQDLRYGGRQLRKAPGFAAVAAATLALGIGGTTAMFSLVHAVLLEPLPYEQPGQLVRLYQQEPDKPSTRHYMTAAHFSAIRAQATAFDEIAVIDNYYAAANGLDLTAGGQPLRLRVLPVSHEYFRTLRAGTLQGPGFELDDETGRKRVVLSDAIWRARFGADPSILGKAILLSGESYDVAAIAPAGAEDPLEGRIDAWIPYGVARDTSEWNNGLSVIARLRGGVTLAQASAELASLSQALHERWPAVRLHSIVAVPLRDDVASAARGPLRLLVLAVGLVLLVACVNVANLALVRATGRVHEFAIRAALGSGRARLAGQLLVESLLLAAMGGALGVVVALSVVSALRRFAPDALPRLGASGLDTAVLAFAAIVTMTSAVVFGVAPALRLARADPTHALREQSRTATGSRAQARLRSGLVVAQLAAALALSSGACVLFASVHRLQTLDLGFRTDRVLTFEINLPTVRYDPARRAAFQEELSRRLQGIPGVTAAGATSRLPGTGSYHPWSARIDSGRLAGTSISRTSGFPMQNRTVSGDYFRALDIPLLAGRTFDERDEMTRSGAPMRAIVSANFARHAFPGVPLEQVVGQRVSTIIRPREREIIGVVGDVAMDALGTPALVLYHPHRQFAANRNWALTHVVSSEIPAERLIPAVRAAIASLDAELVMHQPAPLDEVVGRGIRRERFAAILMLAFAGVTLLLAALGLYGVIAYTVRERAQEIGIRMALGASAAQVRGLILRQAARVVGAGLALGLGAAVALGRWVASLAIEISPTDPRILGAMAALLAVVGLVSAWVPARRAGDGIIGVSPRP